MSVRETTPPSSGSELELTPYWRKTLQSFMDRWVTLTVDNRRVRARIEELDDQRVWAKVAGGPNGTVGYEYNRISAVEAA